MKRSFFDSAKHVDEADMFVCQQKISIRSGCLVNVVGMFKTGA
jgi:hypothetical protein